MPWVRITPRSLTCVLVGVLFVQGSMSARGAAQAPPSATLRSAAPAPPTRELLDKYCVTCHNEKLRSGGLELTKVDPANPSAHADTWEKVVRKLRMDAMPPVGRPRPDAATSARFVQAIERGIDKAAATHPNPGRTEAVHRLNRAEYQNAVRDLLAVDIDAATVLPADDADRYGFDNIADVLSVSPALLERYLSAARKVGRLAIGRSTSAPVIQTYTLPTLLFQTDRMSEDLPFGSRGGVAVRHQFPSDGEYTFKIRLQRTYVDCIRGIGEPHDLEVRLDDVKVKTFRVGGEGKGKPAPASFCNNLIGDPEWEAYIHGADEHLEGRVTAKAGTHVIGVTFGREMWEPEGVLQPNPTPFSLAINETPDGLPSVDSVTISGPYNPTGVGSTPSRKQIFVCTPARPKGEDACAKQILSTIARRAYRRPVTPKDIDTAMAFYKTGRQSKTRDGSFDAGVQSGIERILVDPDFIFRIEREPATPVQGPAYRISDLELASRLSFFLWSSIPDDQLLDLAARGRLRVPGVLEQQVRRLLADPRAHSLVDNFAGQWLVLRNIRSAAPDAEIYADFDENLREAFQRETELFFASQLENDRSIVELLTADYTFLNERLARHYGVRNVYGNHFRQVALGNNPQRGGLLTHGSLLTVTSYPNRTSPVLRGKWILQNILGTPPPPPPPNVPTLPDKGEGGRPATVRARLEQHRKNPVCATCHATMDPLGFALENYDAIGSWRTTAEGGSAIDSSGTFPGGVAFEGPQGLRGMILAHKQEFVETVTEKLLAYALGRGVQYYDYPSVRKIVRDSASADFRWSAVVLGIVKSEPFQMRTLAAPPAAATVAAAQ